jgi:hypothetical protein
MRNWTMNRYIVKYLDDMTGESVREWEGEAEDSGDALDQAMEDDYYFGKLIGVYEQ